MTDCVGVDVAKGHLDWVLGANGEVKRIENSPAGVRRLVRKLSKLRFDRMKSVPGVGDKVARALLADLPELGTLDRKQISSLVGLAPYARDSGQKSGLRRIERGRAGPRTALYLAAMIASRYNPPLMALHDRLRAAGKPAKVAYVAVARKLLTILNAIVRDHTEWNESMA